MRICVDLGSSAVKVLIGEKRRGKFVVEDFIIQPYETHLNPLKHIVSALKEALWELDIHRGWLHIAIPSAYAIFRYAMFPNVPVKRLESVVASESKKYISPSVGQVVVEPMVFSRTAVVEEPVLLVGVRKGYLDEVETIVREIGFRTRFISVDSLVLANLMSYLYPLYSQPLCVVDMGARHTKIMILKEGKISFVRYVKLGSYDIDLFIKERLDVPLDTAEAIKKGENAVADVISLANRVITSLCNEVFISVDFYESQFGEIPEKLLLVGGGAKLKGLLDVVSDRLNMDVELFSLSESRIVCEDQEVDIRPFLPELAVDLGLLLV